MSVGRVYQGSFGMTGHRWRWAIYTLHIRNPDDLPIMGYVDSLDEAKAAFVRTFTALIESGNVKV